MGSPYDDLQNYSPGGGQLAKLAVSTTAVSTAALTADYYYQVIATVDVYWGAYSTAAVASSTAGEFLPSYDWSPPFKAKAGQVVNAVRKGSTSGHLHTRRLGRA